MMERLTTRQKQLKNNRIFTATEKQEIFEDYLVHGRILKYYAEKYNTDEKRISLIISKMMANKIKPKTT